MRNVFTTHIPAFAEHQNYSESKSCSLPTYFQCKAFATKWVTTSGGLNDKKTA